MTPKTYQAHAPAKINLALHVTGQRPDGYHDLDSLVVFARKGDFVRIAEADANNFTVTGPFAELLSDKGNNLVLAAHDEFRKTFGETALPCLSIELEKNLPVAAGIGGGSADAAAALQLFAAKAGVSGDPRIPDLAARLGADVPMCLSASPKRVVEIGDTLAGVPHLPPCHALLVNPLKPVPTPDVFARLTKRQNPPLPEPVGNWEHLDDLVAWLEQTRNDLEGPATALVPEIAEITVQMRALHSCRFARMSGSGATVFGLFEFAEDAENAAIQLRNSRPNDWISVMEIHDSGKFDADQ